MAWTYLAESAGSQRLPHENAHSELFQFSRHAVHVGAVATSSGIIRITKMLFL
jgi:hypothetical protein